MVARIAITGGTGFVGSRAARALSDAGHEIVLVSRGTRRRPRTKGWTYVRADVVAGDGLEKAFAGCDVVINLIAIVREPRDQLFHRLTHRNDTQRFDAVNRGGAQNVADAAAAAGIKHLIHISAIGVDPDPSFPYLASKWNGEQAIRASGVPYTVIRPSILFGPGDEFFTVLTKMIRFNILAPFVIPIAGDGRAKFQPLANADLARIICLAVDLGPTDRVYEVGGPEQMSYDDIIHAIRRAIGVTMRLEVHVPVGLLLPPITALNALLRRPPATPGQLKLLARNNVTRPGIVKKDWGFDPAAFADSSSYLEDY